MRSPGSTHLASSNLILKRTAHPYVLVLITRESKANWPSPAAVTLVTKLRKMAYDHATLLIVTATRKAVEQMGVRVQPSANPIGVIFARGQGHFTLGGPPDIQNFVENYKPSSARQPSPRQSPQQQPAVSSAGRQRAPATSGGGAASTSSRRTTSPRVASQTQTRNAATGFEKMEVTDAASTRRAQALYSIFRTGLGSPKGSKFRRLGMILVENGDGEGVTNFVAHVEELKKQLKRTGLKDDVIGAIAKYPSSQGFKKVRDANVRAALDHEYARAQGRAFLVVIVFAAGGNKKIESQVFRRIIVCYTAGAFQNAVNNQLLEA